VHLIFCAGRPTDDRTGEDHDQRQPHLARRPATRGRGQGRRQELLAGRDDLDPRGQGDQGSRRLRHHLGRLPRLRGGQRAAKRHPRKDGGASTSIASPCRRLDHRSARPSRRASWPEDIAADISEAYAQMSATRRAGGTVGRRAVLGHGRGPARRQLRRPAGNVPERHRAPRRCWPPAGAVMPRCSPTGRSPTATSTASTTSTWRCRSVCSRWCARTCRPRG
jgi:hypothetical protein